MNAEINSLVPLPIGTVRNGTGDGIRTRVVGLEDHRTAIVLRPQNLVPDPRIEREPTALQAVVQANYTNRALVAGDGIAPPTSWL